MKLPLLVTAALLVPCHPSLGTSSVPLSWKRVEIESDMFGGASITAALDDSGNLARFDVTLRGKKHEVSDRCLEAFARPWLNDLKLLYSGGWSIQFPYDGSGSVKLESIAHLSFDESGFKSASVELQLDDKHRQYIEVCPLDFERRSLMEASASFKKNRNHTSLQLIAVHLRRGMARDQVEALLGESTLCTDDGKCRYPSDRSETHYDGRATVELTVDYRTPRGQVTQQLQNWLWDFAK